MAVGINLKLELTARQTQALIVGLLLCVSASEITSETLRMTTTYPAPSGVYQRLTAKTTRYTAYASGESGACTYGGVTGPCGANATTPPAPGQIFYNSTLNGFYYTSGRAMPSDQDTWFAPLSGVGEREFIHGYMNTFAPSGGISQKALKAWTAGPTASYIQTYSNGSALYYNKTVNISGLYRIALEGDYCTTQVGTATEADDDTPIQVANPTFWLQRRVAGGDWATVAVSTEELDLSAHGGTMRSIPIAGSPRCVPFSVETVTMQGRGYKWLYRALFREDSNCVPGNFSGVNPCKSDYLRGKNGAANALTLSVTRLLDF